MNLTSDPDEHEFHNILKAETTGLNLDIREMAMSSKDANIISDKTQKLSNQYNAGEMDMPENQNEHVVHNIA